MWHSYRQCVSSSSINLFCWCTNIILIVILSGTPVEFLLQIFPNISSSYSWSHYNPRCGAGHFRPLTPSGVTVGVTVNKQTN